MGSQANLVRGGGAEYWGLILRIGAPGLQMHSVHGLVPPAILTPLLPRLPLQALSPAAWAPPTPPSLPPPIIQSHINNLPKEDSDVTPVKPSFHIHLPSPLPKTDTPPGKRPGQH